MSVAGDAGALMGLSETEITALPYYNCLVPTPGCAISVSVVSFIALILIPEKIGVWAGPGKI